MLRLVFLAFVCLSAAASMSAQERDDEIRYAVRPGDNLTAIALAFGVTAADLMALNGLDDEAVLQPGQSLVIVAGQADDNGETAAPDDVETPPSSERPLPAIDIPAPVIAADAPAFDPTGLQSTVCFAMFQDDSQNGALDANESWLAADGIRLHDETGAEISSPAAANPSQPVCVEDLTPNRYIIRAAPPAGYGLTTAPILHIDLEAGGRLWLHFGAKPGLPAWIVPTAMPDMAEAELEAERSLLMELSGLFVMVLAAATLGGGLLAALIIRIR